MNEVNLHLNDLELKLIDILSYSEPISINDIIKITNNQYSYNQIYHALIFLDRSNLITQNNYLFSINENNDFIKNKLSINELKQIQITIEPDIDIKYLFKYNDVKIKPLETIGYGNSSRSFKRDDAILVENLYKVAKEISSKMTGILNDRRN